MKSSRPPAFRALFLTLALIPAHASAQQKPALPPQTAKPESPAKTGQRPQTLPTKKGGPSRVGLDTSKTIRLTYGYPKWNLSPSQIDTASILLREGGSGRVVQIQLVETAPDSSVFSGLYSVQWEKISELAPEFYAPPQELLTSNKGLRELNQQIANNQLPRRPFILRRSLDGKQFIEVFDTKEQARDAIKAYKAEREALELQREKVVPDSAMQAADLAADAREREAAAKATAERIRIDQVESRKALDKDEIFRLLPQEEQDRRKAESARLVKEAIERYKTGDFKTAMQLFDKALEVDPTNKSAYFQYGVTLYRAEEFNRSLVFITLAQGADVSVAEKEYYRGLNYYRLKEYGNSVEAFKKTIDANHPELSPSAAFYVGMIQFEAKKYDEAKESFEKTLASTTDSKLADRSETYIEQILAIQQFEKERSRKWTLAGTLGLNYDSNILQISDSQRDTGTASDIAGWRFLQQGSLRYRPLYEVKHEFAAQVDVVNLYTVDDGFGSSQELRNADPFVGTVTLPYTYKGLLLGKGYKVDVVPGYETVYMSIENDENKEILNSIILNVLNTVVMNEDWFSNYNLEVRQDSSQLESSTGENDSTALKVKFGFGNFIFLNKEKNKIVTADLGYTQNQAQGDNAVFDRIDLSAGYIGQMPWELTWNAKVAWFNLNYPKNSNNRVDNSYTATVGLSRKINETFSSGLISSYNLNDSNVEAYNYNRLSVILTLTAGVAF